MPTVNIHKAKTELSRLVAQVERGEVDEIIIARNGKPAARLAPLRPKPAGQRIGVAKGKFVVPDPDPALDAEIAALFLGEMPRKTRRAK
jgi:prevent-host-death family protein